MTAPTVVHDRFSIERVYRHARPKVFAAWTNSAAKSQWWGDEHIAVGAHTLDFRVGGREHVSATVPDGPTFTYDALYQDIVDGARIVTSYEMTMAGRRISVSVCTVEFFDADGGATRLVMTEQGAFLDGLDTNAARAEGTEGLLDALGTWLDR
ncbi:MAG: SRPBCC family protein [Jatrophihabitans sp.]|uniref:SRPBCC family protein n=1 Tax=Jatrophihabitans sp. TaxID=1932789 RepID=UPI003F7E94A1